MAIRTRLRTTLIAPAAAFAAVGAMTIVSPVHATPVNVAASSAASAASATTAHAAAGTRWRLAHRDRLRDVRTSTLSNPENLKRVRKNKTADIVRLKATHRRKLVVSSTTRKAMPKDHMGIAVRMSTPSGDEFQVSLIRDLLGPGRRLMLTKENFEPVQCAGLKAERRNSRNLIRIIVPARCIGRPGRVKVGVVTVVRKGDKLFYDDAFDRTTNGQDIAMSRWIPRR